MYCKEEPDSSRKRALWIAEKNPVHFCIVHRVLFAVLFCIMFVPWIHSALLYNVRTVEKRLLYNALLYKSTAEWIQECVMEALLERAWYILEKRKVSEFFLYKSREKSQDTFLYIGSPTHPRCVGLWRLMWCQDCRHIFGCDVKTGFDCWVDSFITEQFVPELLSCEFQPRLGPLCEWFQRHFTSKVILRPRSFHGASEKRKSKYRHEFLNEYGKSGVLRARYILEKELDSCWNRLF